MARNLDGFWTDSTSVARIILLSPITSPLQTRLCASRGTNLIPDPFGSLLDCVPAEQQAHRGHQFFAIRDCDQYGKEWRDSLPETERLFHLSRTNKPASSLCRFLSHPEVEHWKDP